MRNYEGTRTQAQSIWAPVLQHYSHHFIHPNILKQDGAELDKAQVIVMEKLTSMLNLGLELMLRLLEQLLFQYMDGCCSSNAERQCQPKTQCKVSLLHVDSSAVYITRGYKVFNLLRYSD